MDRSSRSREKKDKVYDYPKGAGSRFESEYSRSYTKPTAMTARDRDSSPYHHDTVYPSHPSPSPSPTNTNAAAVRLNKPQTPYPHPSHSSARSYYRSSTAVPASFHTLNTINKMEQILKKSVGHPTSESPTHNLTKEPTTRNSAQSTAKISGHMNQMYGMKGSGSATAPRSDESNSKMREGDNTWSINTAKGYENINEEGEEEQQGKTKEGERRKGQGDNTAKGSTKLPNRPILTKPKFSMDQMTCRWPTDKQTGRNSKAESQKKVRFSDNITTHLVPYEERGSIEWRKNILAMNMNYRSYMGIPGLRNLQMPMTLPDFTYKSNRPPTTGYDPSGQSLLMPLMMPSSHSNSIGNAWNKSGRSNYGSNANSALCGDYQVEQDRNRHFDSGLKNTKPKSPYQDNNGVYNFPAPRRR